MFFLGKEQSSQDTTAPPKGFLKHTGRNSGNKKGRTNEKLQARSNTDRDSQSTKGLTSSMKTPVNLEMKERIKSVDNTVINLWDVDLQERHTMLLKRGLSFSPTNLMSNFEVYKDIVLFLRKVYLRQIHQRPEIEELPPEQSDPRELIVLDTLISLFTLMPSILSKTKYESEIKRQLNNESKDH